MSSFLNWVELTWSIESSQRNLGDLAMREAAEVLFEFDKLIENGYGAAIFGGSALNSYYFNKCESDLSNIQVMFWGCGFKNDELYRIPQNAIINGVRGFKSQALLNETKVLGDPGMIAPAVLGTQIRDVFDRKDILYIPHFSNQGTFPYSSDIKFVSPLIDFGISSRRIIDQIATAKFLLTDSLHAGIFALACGTPFAFYEGENEEDDFKYQDFFSVFGIEYLKSKSVVSGIEWYVENQIYDLEFNPILISNLIHSMDEFLIDGRDVILSSILRWFEYSNKIRTSTWKTL